MSRFQKKTRETKNGDPAKNLLILWSSVNGKLAVFVSRNQLQQSKNLTKLRERIYSLMTNHELQPAGLKDLAIHGLKA